METNGFTQLRKKFSTAGNLPELPGASLKLIQALEGDNATSAEIERIVSGDPALTAALLRAASSALYGGLGEVTTVRGAVTRLGMRAVQAVAVSIGVQSMMGKAGASQLFDGSRYARHSIFVGFLARYLFACRYNKEQFHSRWSRDELFAAGVLHEIGIGLLARIDQEAYGFVYSRAQQAQSSLVVAFQKIYGASVHELAVIAAETWRLPSLFSHMIAGFDNPSSNEEEQISISCLLYADYLAEQNQYGMTRWVAVDPIEMQLFADVALPAEDIPGVIDVVSRHTASYVPLANAA